MVNKILFIFALIGIVFAGWFLINIKPASQSKDFKAFVIPKGQPTRTILNRLQTEGIIRSAPAAEIYLFLTKQRGIFQAGSFRLNPAMTISEITQALKTGTLDIWTTIPEGWRAEQIVDELIKEGFFENENIYDIYKQFRKSEGRLFPDTYLFAKDSTPEMIIKRMTENFDTKTLSLTNERINPLTHELIIQASLVEREAKHDADRPLIAGVLKNRLKIGMALQVDATLQYAKATQEARNRKQETMIGWWEPISPADKNINSPYNTYKFPGLPPGPIANPGIEAIEAVFNPAKTDYLYYISEPDGTSHYAKTLEEHNANIKKYLMR